MTSQTLPEKEWINPPLGVALRNYLKLIDWEIHPLGTKVRVMRRNPGKLWEWSLCCLLLLHDNLRHSFRSTLSKTQFGSFLNLLEWWTGKYQDGRLSAAAIAYIVLDSVVGLPQDETFRDMAAKLSKSAYHFQLFDLFCLEFSVHTKPATSSIFPAELTRARESAAVYASTQRIGCICYQEAVKKHRQSLGQLDEPKAESDATTFGNSIAQALNHLITAGSVEIQEAQSRVKIPLHAAAVWPFELGQVMDSVYTTPNTGVVLEPCPWLTSEEKSGLPHYLWDVEKGRTVETAGLKSPSYTAISHTWGRWRVQGSAARLDGVEWPVPRNTLFFVEDLPGILRDVPREGGYVWLDLVCIPQDTENPAMAEIAYREIARQAKIFGTASRAVVWLSDVESLDSLKSMARWMALSLLEHPPGGRSEFNPLDEERRRVESFSSPVLIKTADQVRELAKQKYGSEDLTSEEPLQKATMENLLDYCHGWLSSLWTLQEACLRPDMWLCSRDWTVLRLIDGRRGSPLQLDGLMALTRQSFVPRYTKDTVAITECYIRHRHPKNMMSLAFILMSVGMTAIFQPSIGDILWLGSRRYCLMKRSEAIMSVVGVADWEGRARQEDLVFDKYPVAFLEKVRLRWGSVFFNSVRFTAESGRNSGDDAIGSMLPFQPGYRSGFMLPQLYHGHPDLLEHDSVASWEIQRDGSVRICNAAIIASPETANQEPLQSTLFIPNEQNTSGDLIEFDSDVSVELGEWIRTRTYECYAVCTAYAHSYVEHADRTSWECRGILLEKVRHLPGVVADPSGATPDYFVKIGLFIIVNEGMMQAEHFTPSTKVNWVAL